jgi:hypothetical protein
LERAAVASALDDAPVMHSDGWIGEAAGALDALAAAIDDAAGDDIAA